MLIGRLILDIKRRYNIISEYMHDENMYRKNNGYSVPNTINKISYNMIRIVHSVEKGLSNENPRPFGIRATNELMQLIKQYEKMSDDDSFSYDMALTCLNEYLNFYKKKGWTGEKQYKKVKKFTKDRKYEIVGSGSKKIVKEELNKGKFFDYGSFLKTRHSVRKFDGKKVPEKIIEKATRMALLTPSACNRQMVKIYDIRNKNSIEYITKIAQGIGGFETDNISYLVITFDLNSEYFVGERNQGWFNSGLFSMNLVNSLHSMGVGSCFIQFGNTFREEQLLKKRINIPNNERIAVIIAYGFYASKNRVPYSTRKDLDEILRKR